MKIATLEQIGKSLGVTKQLVSRDIVKVGLLLKNEDGKIDIEAPENRAYLKSKGANMEIFYPKTPTPKKSTKIKKKPLKLSKKEENAGISDVKTAKTKTKENKSTQNEMLDLEKDNKIRKNELLKIKIELDELKLETEKNNLISKDIAKSYIFEILGAFSQVVTVMPHSIVDEILSFSAEKEGAREKILKLLSDKYSSEINKGYYEAKKKLGDQAKKIFGEQNVQ